MAPGARAALVAVVAAGLLFACGGAREANPGDLSLELTIDPSPPRVGKANLTLLLTDAEGGPVQGAVVRIEGNMNHAGMTPVFADASEVGAGRYRAELEFTMGGDWFLLVEARTADGGSQRWREDVPGVQVD